MYEYFLTFEHQLTAVESKIASLHRRIDMELDQRKQHDVRLTSAERHLKLPEAAYRNSASP